MDKQPRPGQFGDVTEAPICAAGQLPADLFYDNMENPASGNWVRQTTRGTNAWTHDTGYTTSGLYSLYMPNQPTRSDVSLARSAGVTVPTGKTTYMRFSHAPDFASAPHSPAACPRGGVWCPMAELRCCGPTPSRFSAYCWSRRPGPE